MIQEKCINVYKRPDDGSQLEPKQLAVNKLKKLVLCATDLINRRVIFNNNGEVSFKKRNRRFFLSHACHMLCL